MRIIDFERKGNLVRFYLGDEDLHKWGGDDWDDTPYEHNAGRVYDEYIKGYCDVLFPFDDLVLEPCCGTCNSGWCKNDMVARKVPCIIQVPATVHNDSFDKSFDRWVGAINVNRFYFNNRIDPSAKTLSINSRIINMKFFNSEV